jgi:L-ascorbate metabolism protein UlaG (beta-lactamase superfamily)
MEVSTTPLRITMIGHSTVLLEIGGMRILTDPFFGLHGNPAYRRVAPPAASREEVADVDMVLLSHDHWDHFDRRFFRMLPASVPVVVPAATRGWMRFRGVRLPVGIRHWDSLRHHGVTVWGVPAHHFAVAHGFVIEHGRQRVYFAGDTFHGRFHERIARELAPAVALLPVTTYRLPMTMGEDQAVRAVRDLQPQVVVPIHLGIEPRSPLLRSSQTVERFAEKLHRAAPPVQVVHLREGESWESEQEEEAQHDFPGHPGDHAHARPTPGPIPGSGPRPRDRRLAPLVVRMIGHRAEVGTRPDEAQSYADHSGRVDHTGEANRAGPAEGAGQADRTDHDTAYYAGPPAA